MALMGDLYLGASALRVNQYALNTVAHNLANVETKGFVRQQTVFRNMPYQTIGQTPISYKQLGSGVDTQTVRQVRNIFLDQAYRMESGRQGFYDSQVDAVNEIESLFGELEGVAFQDTMDQIWVSLQELAKEPESLVTQASFVETSLSFVERASAIYKQLTIYQLNLNTKIAEKVNRINELSNGIYEMNEKISKYEASKVEHANDYRDSRNHMLDELSGLINIDYKEYESGRVSVLAEGAILVSETTAYQMGMQTRGEIMAKQGIEIPLDEMAGVLIPVWPALDNMQVYHLDKVPSTEDGTNVGSLRGVLAARGIGVGKTPDIPVEPDKKLYTDEYGELDEEAYGIVLAKYNQDVEIYNRDVEHSIVRRTQAQFDQLVHGIVTTINDVLSPNKKVLISAGETLTMEDGSEYTFEEDTYISVLDEEKAPVGLDEAAEQGTELFSRKGTPRYLEPQDIVLADGTMIENARVHRWEDPSDNYTLYTLGEIEVNPEIVINKSKLPIRKNDGTGNYDIKTVEKLIEEWQKPFATLSPNTLTYNNFMDYYTQLTGEVGARGDEYTTLAEGQTSMVNSIQSQRLSDTAVSSDEELSFLIKYQHAYNAASRYITVVSEMLEHVIMRM